MKKTRAALLCAFAVLLAAFAFSACSKDDEEDSYDISTLEGNWINEEAEEMVVFSNGRMYTRYYANGSYCRDDEGRVAYDAKNKAILWWEDEDDTEPYYMYVTWLSKDKIHIIEEDGSDWGVYVRTDRQSLPESWNH